MNMENVQAVVFDIDGTLVDGNSWSALTHALGASVSELHTLRAQLGRGEISYPEAKEALLRMWQETGNARREIFEDTLRTLPLRDGAHDVVAKFMQRGITPCLITGSMDVYAEIIARRLDIRHYYANTTLHWGQAGELSDLDYVVDQSARKVVHLKEFLHVQGFTAEQCVAVGDDNNDIGMFAMVHGIALRGSHSANLEAYAWRSVDTLGELSALVCDPPANARS